ncbi:hypothetical protein [Alistipes finegoldii]|jgi:hypothetical protein|uniref:hypothetical protein n=1 Tax=Alistipes finegoldii TaxID=214856 RepID=UPI00243043BF|nr:hypothetical protein [Alistipes finegoldii]
MILKPLHVRFLVAMQNIIKDKKARRIVPSAALSMELVHALSLSRTEVERIGAELAAAGEISTGDTINQKYYNSRTNEQA